MVKRCHGCATDRLPEIHNFFKDLSSLEKIDNASIPFWNQRTNGVYNYQVILQFSLYQTNSFAGIYRFA